MNNLRWLTRYGVRRLQYEVVEVNILPGAPQDGSHIDESFIERTTEWINVPEILEIKEG